VTIGIITKVWKRPCQAKVKLLQPTRWKKGKDKNKDMTILVEERLIEINTFVSALIDIVDDMAKRIGEL